MKLPPGPGKTLEDGLAAIYNKQANDNSTTYVAKELIDFNGTRYQHVIVQYPGRDGEGSTFSVGFANVGSKPLEKLTMYDFVLTKRIPDSRLADEVIPLVNRAAKDPLQKAVDSIIGAFATAGVKDGKVKLKEEDVKTLANEAVRNLLSV